MRSWVQGDPEAVLAVEYYGDSEGELASKLDELEVLLGKQNLEYTFSRAISDVEQANVWNVRKAGLGLLMGLKAIPNPSLLSKTPLYRQKGYQIIFLSLAHW